MWTNIHNKIISAIVFYLIGDHLPVVQSTNISYRDMKTPSCERQFSNKNINLFHEALTDVRTDDIFAQTEPDGAMNSLMNRYTLFLITTFHTPINEKLITQMHGLLIILKNYNAKESSIKNTSKQNLK